MSNWNDSQNASSGKKSFTDRRTIVDSKKPAISKIWISLVIISLFQRPMSPLKCWITPRPMSWMAPATLGRRNANLTCSESNTLYVHNHCLYCALHFSARKCQPSTCSEHYKISFTPCRKRVMVLWHLGLCTLPVTRTGKCSVVVKLPTRRTKTRGQKKWHCSGTAGMWQQVRVQPTQTTAEKH